VEELSSVKCSVLRQAAGTKRASSSAANRLGSLSSSAVTSNVRRATGTKNFSDVLLHWLWLKRRTPAQDIADFAAGVTLKVMCFSRPWGATARSQVGCMYLTEGLPITWQTAGGQAVTLHHSLALTPSGEPTWHWKFSAFRLDTATGPLGVKLPKTDVELVNHALASTTH
jgi:hypothetical protein